MPYLCAERKDHMNNIDLWFRKNYIFFGVKEARVKLEEYDDDIPSGNGAVEH